MTDLHRPGAKDDSEKPRLDLVLGEFNKALWAVGEVGTFGANKYTDNGWKGVPYPMERYSSAMLRHYFKYKQGEDTDPESKLPHLAHMAWNALAILEKYLEIPKANVIDTPTGLTTSIWYTK